MSRFTASWLALREPVDARSRSIGLAAAFAARLPAEPRLLDLGAGTGANLRWLAPRLGRRRQHWVLVDADGDLLAGVGTPDPAVTVETHCLDLAPGIASVDFDGCDGVLATAFLDLVSAAWLDRLVERLAGRPLLVALSIDERLDWLPADPADGEVRDALFGHHRRDKGFGPALGPEAPAELARRLTASGYRVERRLTDWLLGPADHELIGALLVGWAAAAREARPEAAERIDAWAGRREAQRLAGRLTVQVGHQDIAAWR